MESKFSDNQEHRYFSGFLHQAKGDFGVALWSYSCCFVNFLETEALSSIKVEVLFYIFANRFFTPNQIVKKTVVKYCLFSLSLSPWLHALFDYQCQIKSTKCFSRCIWFNNRFRGLLLEHVLLQRRQWRRSGVFIVNFEHISHLVLVFVLLTLNM